MDQVVIEGKLQYLGWSRPWEVNSEARSSDLSTVFWDVAGRLKDRPATIIYERDGFSLFADPASEYLVDFDEVGSGILLMKKGPTWGLTNILAYAEAVLCGLNGREIIASVEDEKISFFANPIEDVPGVKYFGAGNMARIPDGMEKGVCRIGEGAECCIFTVFGSAGFECAKFSGSLARGLIERKAAGSMNAGRIGNCRLLGREGQE